VRETRELDRRINQPEAPAELQTVGPGSLSSFGCNLAAQSSSHSTFKHRLTHQQGDPESRALKSGEGGWGNCDKAGQHGTMHP